MRVLMVRFNRECLTGRIVGLSSAQVEIVPKRRKNRHREWTLFVGLAVYMFSFLAFYPKTFAIVDEDAYLTQAYLFRSGRLSYDGSPINEPHFTVNLAGHSVSKYPPGNALFLVPFIWFGWRAVFVSGLALALIGTLLVRAVLREVAPDVDSAWSLLYLLYPSVVLLSRTVMSDLLGATAVVATAWFLVKHNRLPLAAGLSLGLACLVRYSNAALVPAFLVALLSIRRGRYRAVGLFAAGLVPGFLAVLFYNSYAFGAPLGFPMFLTGHFAVWYFPRNLLYYSVTLLAFYPLMLLAPLVNGRRNLIVLGLPATVILVLFCFFSYIYETPSLALRVAFGTRYLLPAIPFFTTAYAIILGRLELKIRHGSTLKYAVLAALSVLALVIQYRHHSLLETQARYQRMLYEAVPEGVLLVCSPEASELVSHVWGKRDYVEYAGFGVPIPLAGKIADSDTVYVATLRKPGRSYTLDSAILETLLARNGSPEPVARTEEPWWFRVYRLKP